LGDDIDGVISGACIEGGREGGREEGMREAGGTEEKKHA
jgi:hypothetical protein